MNARASKRVQWMHAHRRSLSHSTQVRLLRVLIPATALLILVSLFLWSPLENFLSSKGLQADMKAQDLTLRNTVINPDIHGIDRQGKPYHLHARQAHQITPDKAALSKPQGEVLCENNVRVKVTSLAGTYQAQDQVLSCEEQVQVTTSDGYTLNTDKAHVTFSTKQTQGEGAVHGQGPTGALQGTQGFTLTQEGYLHVPGPSKLTLRPAQKITPPVLEPTPQ